MQFHSIKSLFKKLYAPYESNLTAAYEDAGILNLTEQEITGLNEYQRQVKDIESKALSMANDLIAYAGANYILGVIKKSVLDNKTNNITILCFIYNVCLHSVFKIITLDCEIVNIC